MINDELTIWENNRWYQYHGIDRWHLFYDTTCIDTFLLNIQCPALLRSTGKVFSSRYKVMVFIWKANFCRMGTNTAYTHNQLIVDTY